MTGNCSGTLWEEKNSMPRPKEKKKKTVEKLEEEALSPTRCGRNTGMETQV